MVFLYMISINKLMDVGRDSLGGAMRYACLSDWCRHGVSAELLPPAPSHVLEPLVMNECALPVSCRSGWRVSIGQWCVVS